MTYTKYFFFKFKTIFPIEPILWTAVRLSDSFVKSDVNLNVSELQNLFKLLILGSWEPFENKGGQGQYLLLLLLLVGIIISRKLSLTKYHYVLGIELNALLASFNFHSYSMIYVLFLSYGLKKMRIWKIKWLA